MIRLKNQIVVCTALLWFRFGWWIPVAQFIQVEVLTRQGARSIMTVIQRVVVMVPGVVNWWRKTSWSCCSGASYLLQAIVGMYIATDKALFSSEKMLISFLFLHENICCGYLLEAPRWGASNEYPQHMFLWRNKKNIMWIPPLICSYVCIYIYDL